MKGYPDWNKPTIITAQEVENLNININAQTIERLIEAPSYGGARYIQSSGSVEPGDDVVIASITGAGIIYGGFIVITDERTPERGGIGIDIDGTGFPSLTFARLDEAQIYERNNWFVYLRKYDTTNYFYVLAFTPGVTFDSSYKVHYGRIPTAVGDGNYDLYLIYALRA